MISDYCFSVDLELDPKIPLAIGRLIRAVFVPLSALYDFELDTLNDWLFDEVCSNYVDDKVCFVDYNLIPDLIAICFY